MTELKTLSVDYVGNSSSVTSFCDDRKLKVHFPCRNTNTNRIRHLHLRVSCGAVELHLYNVYYTNTNMRLHNTKFVFLYKLLFLSNKTEDLN